MKTRKSGAEAGAGSRVPRSLFRPALLAVLLLILAFLVWVLACVPPGEGPHTGTPEPEPVETPALIRLPLSLQSGETAVPQAETPEPEGTPAPETGEPEDVPMPAESTPAAARAGTGGGSGAYRSGMLGVLTYQRKSVGIRPDIREETLLKGPGWVPESALPGEGMCVIFGHRNRNHLLLIKKIKEGDTLTFQYADGRTLTYRVRSVQIFETTSQWRLPTENGDVLVIATCYPFQYTGSAPGKFQVIADRIG
jgi:LPXTG-site transpeptidase (sortase) family protein